MATGHSGLRVGLRGGAGGAGGPGVEHMWRCERDADAAMKRDLDCLGRMNSLPVDEVINAGEKNHSAFQSHILAQSARGAVTSQEQEAHVCIKDFYLPCCVPWHLNSRTIGFRPLVLLVWLHWKVEKRQLTRGSQCNPVIWPTAAIGHVNNSNQATAVAALLEKIHIHQFSFLNCNFNFYTQFFCFDTNY